MAHLSLKSRRIIAALTCSIAVTSSSTPVATAQPTNPDDTAIATAEAEVENNSKTVSQLVTSLSTTQDEITQLENEMGGLREAVNKSLVDLHDAQASAEQARQNARAAREELDNAQKEIEQAQKLLDEFSRSAYRQGASNPGVAGMAGTSNTEDALDRQTYLRTNIAKQKEAIDRLDRLRTEKANKESQLRETKKIAEQRENAAADAKTQAQNAINQNSTLIQQRSESLNKLIEQRDDAQKQLDAAKTHSTDLNSQRKEYEDYQTAKEERERAEAEAKAAEDARRIAEEFAATKAREQAQAEAEAQQTTRDAEEQQAAQEHAEDKAAEAEQSQAAAERSVHDEQQAQQNRTAAEAAVVTTAAALIAAASPDHTTLDSPYPTEDDADATEIAAVQNPEENEGTSENSTELNTFNNVSDNASATVSGSREEKIEAVIARAQSQLGVTYAWGGGDANGPTLGIRDGGVADSFGDFNKVGFDCSGLVLYAFAGIGIALPHYTGYQYQRGTKISPNEMQRGDLIFYGPNAEHHVAIYLGDGQMIEAPQSGTTVQISPVRWSGMSPYVVRMI